MGEFTYHTYDKSAWGDGPWQSEPDHVETRDEATGLLVLMNRNHVGAWCGYVAVPPGHPLHGKTDRHNTEISSNLFMRKMSEQLEKYGGYGNIPEDAESPSDVLEVHPDYYEKLHELRCHGGVTYTCMYKLLDSSDFQRWQKYMLEVQPTIEEFPNGDAAEAWKEAGHLIDNEIGWITYRTMRSISHHAGLGWWFIGFDCSHGGDLSPKMEAQLNSIRLRDPSFPRLPKGKGIFGYETYRTLGYVRQQCRSLAKQVRKLAFESIRVDIFVKYKGKRKRYHQWRVQCERI